MNRHSEICSKCPERIISESITYIHLNALFIYLFISVGIEICSRVEKKKA